MRILGIDTVQISSSVRAEPSCRYARQPSRQLGVSMSGERFCGLSGAHIRQFQVGYAARNGTSPLVGFRIGVRSSARGARRSPCRSGGRQLAVGLPER